MRAEAARHLLRRSRGTLVEQLAQLVRPPVCDIRERVAFDHHQIGELARKDT
jgi:hypothetical protein